VTLPTVFVSGALAVFGAVLAFRLHQERVFPAVDFPPMASEPLALPMRDEQQVALVELAGESRAYPLDYVIHHHIVNDRFGDRVVALTYCAMCRTVIAFDVTELGPLLRAHLGSWPDGGAPHARPARGWWASWTQQCQLAHG